MKNKLMIIVLTALIGLVSCKKDNHTPLEMKHIDVTPKQVELINNWNEFGFKFFKEVTNLSVGDKNLMISPLSVSMALGMTRNGANGTTLGSMNDVLGFSGLTDQEINESYKYLIETFVSLDPSVKLAIANSIWYKNTFSVEQPFINSNKAFFNAQVNSLDFSNPASVNVINSWVSDNTNKLIPSIIDQIPGDAVMYLVNAVYFKGQWKNQFKKENTSQKPFILDDGSTVQVPMMAQTATLPLLSRSNLTAVELPYNRGNYNMIVILPEGESTIEQIITQLSSDNWTEWQKSFSNSNVMLQMPKFKFKYNEENMKDALTALGMGVVFNPSMADFSRINSSSRVFVSDIRHKTFIETNEEGTEAAAVTSVEMSVTSAPDNYPFIVNKPFVFMISEKSTGTVLFIGAVKNPLED